MSEITPQDTDTAEDMPSEVDEPQRPTAGQDAADAAPADAALPEPEPEPDPEPVTVPAKEWAALQEAQGTAEDRALRLQAEFENYRKRVAKERLQARDGAVEGVTRGFLAVVDNFDRAIASAQEHGLEEQLLSGWQMIHQQLYDVLRGFGVEPMAVIGQPFDPRFHEAVTEVADDTHPAGHVAAEVERGYMLGDRVLRTARVAVSGGPADPAPKPQ